LPIPFATVIDLQAALNKDRIDGKKIGFVPTMGALHAGHLSLIARAAEENDVVVCSIFVNPTQFNNASDLEKYPRMPDADIHLLKQAGCDYAFLPSVDEIYPNGKQLLDIDFGALEKVMEGEFRPGHFKGMATVVNRLFEIVNPEKAYFGKKDFQQLAIVKNMVKQLRLPVNVIGCDTLREDDGLAMSSRNMLLTPPQRKAAPLIYKGMMTAQEFIPYHTVEAVKELVIRYIQQSPLLKVEYFEIVNPETLQPIQNWSECKEVQACIAVLTEGPRLIDNVTYSTL
jgi:pantoate--beta-alanine ligase